MAILQDSVAIANAGWWLTGLTEDRQAIATRGWFPTDLTPIVPSESNVGQFGDWYFRVPPIGSSDMELRRAFQNIQLLLRRTTQFLPEAGSEFPPNPGNGKLFYDVDEGILYVFITGTGWVPTFTGGGVPTTQQFQLVSGDNFVLVSGDDFILVEEVT